MSKIINQLNRLSTFASHHTDPRASWLLSTFRPLTLGLLLTFSLLISNCGLDIEDPTPPSPPVWVQKSLPEEWPERGVDAHESGGIFLEWYPSVTENISAYLIYCAQFSVQAASWGEYEMIARRESQPHEELNYLYSEAIIGVGYSFLLRAEETPGNLSIYSDSLAYTLLPSIGTNRMSPNGMTELLSPGRSLTWAFFPQIKMEDYCLTILNQFDEFIFRIILHPTDYVAGSDSYNILEDVILHPNGLYKWRIDMGAKYVNNKETVGSESGWAYFLIPSDPSIK